MVGGGGGEGLRETATEGKKKRVSLFLVLSVRIENRSTG